MALTTHVFLPHICRSVYGILMFLFIIHNSACSLNNLNKKNTDVHWELTQEAQVIYGVLLLEQSIRLSNRDGVLEAIDILSKYKPEAQFFMDSAAWLLLERDPKTARSILKQGLKTLPDNFGLHLLLAESWLEEDEPTWALKVLQEYQKCHPGFIPVRQELAILYLKIGKYKEAHKIFSSLPKRYKNAFIRYCHAQVLIALNKPEEAMQQLNMVVKEKAEFLEAWFEIGKLLERSGKYNDAILVYLDLLDKDTNNQDVWLHLIETTLVAKNPKKALKYVSSSPESYGLRLSLILLFLEHKYYSQAETLLLQLKQKNSTPTDVNFFLAAIAYEYHKNSDSSIEFLEQIHPESKYYNKSLLMQAQIFYNIGKLEKVLFILQQLENCEEFNQDLYVMELHVLLTKKDYKQALEKANKALEVFPEERTILFLKGVALDGLGNRVEALQFMENILIIYPEYPEVLNFVGYTLIEEKKDIDRALVLIEKANALMPNRAYIVDSLAWALFFKGDYEKAWAVIKHAVELEGSDDPTIWEHYGDIALALKKKALARKGWEKALKLQPRDPTQIQEKLKKL